MVKQIRATTPYDAKYGFAAAHWETIREYADFTGLVLMFRSGKQASIKWIEKKFPAKPMTFKIKVDPESGLLTARSDDEKQAVGRAGHWVLRADLSRPGEFIAFSPIDPSVERARFTNSAHDWADEGVVVHSQLGEPFTSDYDLAAVVATRGEFRQLPTNMPFSPQKETRFLKSPGRSGRDLFAKDHIKKVLNRLADPVHGWENRWTQSVREDLNHRFGDERIQHGPQILYVDPDRIKGNPTRALPYVQLTSGDSPESILAFAPSRSVRVHQCQNAADSHRILRQYLGS